MNSILMFFNICVSGFLFINTYKLSEFQNQNWDSFNTNFPYTIALYLFAMVCFAWIFFRNDPESKKDDK